MPYKYPGFTLAHPFPDPRPNSKHGWHGGADYAAEAGTEVPAMYAGMVFRSGFIHGYGMAVIVKTETATGPIFTLYGHLGPNRMPAVDAEIKPGQIIGEVASRKYNETFKLHYNPHLHLEIINHRANLNATGDLGGWSSDITHRANPETFDINDPKFPYESIGAPPHPGRNSPGAKPPALSPPAARVAPNSPLGPPLDLTPHGLPPTPRGGFGSSPLDPLGALHFNPQPSPQQFGPFTLPSPNSSGTDISASRNGNPMGSSIPIVSTPGQFGNDLGNAPPGASLQPTNGNAADRTGGNDIGGVWTTAQQYISGQPARMQPAVAPSDDVPGAFPENGASPIGYLNEASQTGTFDPAAPDVPRPRPRPPQAPASWPSSPVAPLQQMPQAEPAAPWHPDGQEAGDGPRQNLPNWAQMQPPTENTFPTSNGVRGMAGDQPLPSENDAPPPALTVQNLTTHVLRMKGVPDADIGAAISDPAKMQSLLNQVYDRRSMTAPGDGNGGFGNQFGQAISGGQPGQTPTPAAAPPNDYIPFGWTGLPPLLR
jgi:murein DD-endopeptidase MepM/ murein hydrolase activator NlpD